MYCSMFANIFRISRLDMIPHGFFSLVSFINIIKKIKSTQSFIQQLTSGGSLIEF